MFVIVGRSVIVFELVVIANSALVSLFCDLKRTRRKNGLKKIDLMLKSLETVSRILFFVFRVFDYATTMSY